MKIQTGKFINKSFLGTIWTGLFTAFLIYILEIIFVVAFTALIYSGELSSQVPRALVYIMAGDAILCVVVAWFSSDPASIAVEQDAPGAMLSLIAAGIIAVLSGTVTRQFATVTMMIMMTTLPDRAYLGFIGGV